MLKLFVFVSVICSVVYARPQDSNTTPVPILAQSQSLDGLGTFDFNYEAGNGIRADAQGNLKSIKVPKKDPQTGQIVGETEGLGNVQRGSYSYTAPDGQVITVNWIADENGFQPDNLPRGP